MKNNLLFIITVVILLIAFIVIYFKFNTCQITFVVDNEIFNTVEIRPNTKLTETPTPTKEGYAFIGWYDSEGNIYSSNTKINKDTVYYARWATIITDEES